MQFGHRPVCILPLYSSSMIQNGGYDSDLDMSNLHKVYSEFLHVCTNDQLIHLIYRQSNTSVSSMK